MAKVKFNANYVETMAAVIGNKGTGFSREIANILSGRTFNSVNATLAAMAGKGYLTKVKGVFNEKLLTKYSITAEGQAAYDEAVAGEAKEVIVMVTEDGEEIEYTEVEDEDSFEDEDLGDEEEEDAE